MVKVVAAYEDFYHGLSAILLAYDDTSSSPGRAFSLDALDRTPLSWIKSGKDPEIPIRIDRLSG